MTTLSASILDHQVMTWEGKRVVEQVRDFNRDGYLLMLEGGERAFVSRDTMGLTRFPVTLGTKIVDPRPLAMTLHSAAAILPKTTVRAPEPPQERVATRTSVIDKLGFGGRLERPARVQAAVVSKAPNPYLAEALF